MSSQAEFLEAPVFSQDIPSRSLLRQLEWFRGLEDPRVAVFKHIDEEVARKEKVSRTEEHPPRSESSKALRERFVRSISDYLALTIKVGVHTCDVAGIEFPGEELRIVQVRADFDFRTWLVKILFVIDADLQEERSFHQLLHKIEKAVLAAERFMAELQYVNKRTSGINFDTMRRDYPFVGKARSAAPNGEE